MSPDPLLNSGRPEDPQSWNRYSYVSNNPLMFRDPLGLFKWASNCDEANDAACHGQRQRFRDALGKLKTADAALEKGSPEKKELDKALKRIGEEDKGDVKVAFGDAGKDQNGRSYLGSTVGNTMTINWSAESNTIGSWASHFGLQGDAASSFMSDYDAALVGHEGGHLSDSDFGPMQFIMHTESTALFSESAPYQGLHFNDKAYGLWNPSWAQVDKQNTVINRPEMEQNRSQAIQQAKEGPK